MTPAGSTTTRRRGRRRIVAAPGGETGPLLEVTDLHTGFVTPHGLVRAVDGVSFTLDRGRTLGVVGESGSGKSVLARSVMGLLGARNVRRSGSVRYAGRELTALSSKDLRDLWGTGMAMVFQDPMTSLNPVMRIGRQLTEGLRRHLDLGKDEATEIAIQLLGSVGIPDPKKRLRQYPHELSGGMRQRVTIAIALACGPKLLFADEPTTALDVTVQAQILNLLQTQQSERHMGMILVTHDLGVVAGRTDDIAVMYAGQIVEIAPTATLFTSTRMPYTEALLKSIPKLEQPSHTRLEIIGGRPPDLISPPAGCRFAPRCPYVQQRCWDELPPLVEAEQPGHLYRCWYPVGTDAGRAALERNLAAGVAVTVASTTGDAAGAELAAEHAGHADRTPRAAPTPSAGA